MRNQQVKAPSASHNNADLLVWSIFLLDGYERWVDVEEMYLKAFELAPARLGWRTRPDIPDYKKCAKALQELEDVKRSEHLGLLVKQGSYLRKLTDEGFRWCREYQTILSKLYSGGVVPAAATQEASRVIRDLEQSEAFQDFLRNGRLNCDLWELAEAMRCMNDSPELVWSARFDSISVAAMTNDRQDIVDFVEVSREFVRKQIESKVR
jgi:hypothetical protein